VISAARFLFITARDTLGNELQTLYARKLAIKANGYSGVVADPAPASAVVRLTSATPDDDGMHTFTALGKTWRAALNDFDDA
jgi:hypothetical protein